MASLASLPVIVMSRCVRLSRVHHEVLFGPDVALLDIAPIGNSGLFATPEVVEVRGPLGVIQHVRVVGPHVKHTEVRVTVRDAAALGLGAPAPGRAQADSPGCTLAGPRGTVVLASGVIAGLRRLCLPPSIASEASLADASLAHVIVRGQRARELRDVPVEVGQGPWLMLDLDDANSLEVGPLSTASITA